MGSESVSLNLGDSLLWAPYKSLYNVVNNAVVCKDVNLLPDLEFALKKYKPDFICLLKNPACNNAHREAVKKASSTGIAIVGQTGLQVLSQQLVDEALIISDMFNLDEMVSLELLIAGQQQQPHFPGLTRGLVAMLLYYDGRRSLVSSLRTLVQASEGKSWTLGLTPELTSCITNYTNQLKDDGLILKIIDLVENMNVTKELELLHKNRALGAPRYRKQVKDLISEIRQSLAEIVFCWACQKTLTHEETMRLMAYLSKQIELNPDGSMDDASMTLSMAFLYVIDVGYLQTCEELDPGIKQLNLIAFPTIAAAIHKELNSTDARWQTVGLKSVFQFAWGVTLRTLSQAPFASAGIDLGENFEDDEKMIELAIDGAAFSSLNALIVKSPFFHQEEFFLKRIHSLITDFIVLMPIKVKDMRNRGDESAKIIAAHVQEGLEAPGNLQLHFQHFLTLMANMYSKNPLDLDLALDYWCPMENYVEQSFSHRPSQRQVALFKFIRMAGDLLPAPLFIPYHEMLTSLASSPLCAHHCFNLLKMNGQNVVGGHYSIVSWDHFFSTLYNYYNNLREEVAVAPGTGVTYRQRILTRGINPQEVSGLSAVLQLIYEVIKLDPVARLTLAENPKYSPYVVIFGLITCSVPSNLKASLLRCLAAFSSTPVMAFNVWQGVENTQIIPTIQSTAIYHPSGILTELEDVETRKEVYPVTRAILKLINTLLEQLMRTTSVGGLNLPGLQAVLDFVCDKIFLKSTTRVFKDPKEKWQVIALCLKIFQKVLQSYRIGSINYPTNQTYFNIAGSHPGFIVLTEMLQDSGLLRMVLHILDEGVRLLDTYTPFPGKRQMEKSVLLALSVLHISITKQDVFLQHLRDSDCDFLVTSLDNLLMRINPRSGEADHLFNIAKYVTYNTLIPKHSLLAIRILRLLCSSNQVAQHLISVFDVDPSESDTLLHGFVECLEVDIASDLDSESLEDEESMTQVRSKTRAELLMLSLHCLKFSGPNLAHYLLGFNLRRPISQTEIQEPGVMGSRRTCLHAVLALLDAGTNSDSGPINVFKSPKTVDLAYQLIYTLCSNEDTSGPVLRYLRCTHDFFYRHLQFLPHKSTDGFDSRLMSVQSWLLKALAIELRVTSAHHQRSHVQRLLQLLLEDKPPVDNVLSEGTTEPVLGISSFVSYSFMQPNTAPLKRKLMQILDSLDFGHSVKSIPELDYFKVNELQTVFNNCELTEPSGLRVIDIEELNYRLVAETTAQQNMPGFAQKTQILQQEIRLVLNYAKEVNESRLALFAKRQSFNAWRQVAEVILIACPLDVFGSEKKHQVVLEISQELIRRVVGEDFIPELLPAASGVILTLMTALRHGLKSSTSYKLPYLLPESAPLTSVPHFVSSDSSVAITHHSSLLVVLKAIVECLLQIGSGLQRVRANFYTAFLNLLSIVQKPYDVQTQSFSGIESAVLDKESEHRKLRMEFLDTIFGFGEMIMEVICRDACTGHDVTKMLSLAVLDVVISLDTQQQWLSFLVSKGYLRHILDSLKQDDEQLQSLLSRSNRNSSSFRIFYVFESKMALLTRISSSPTGALALLRNGVFGKLADCEALDLRPDEYLCEEMKKENEKWILPNLMKCYRQILKAIMKLILSIIMSLGSDHREVTLQVLGYISHNMNFFLNVLRDRTILNSLEGLEELALVTAVLARASLDDPDKVAEDTILLENRGQFLLLRQHLLMMLPCLLANEGSIFRGQSLAQLNDAENVAKIRIAKLQIASHILDMCCNAVTRSGSDPSNYKILFNPSLNDAASTVSPYAMGVQDVMIHRAGRIPDLGLLVTLIMQCSTQLPSDIENHKSLLRGLHSLPSLTTDELLQYLPSETKIEQTTVQKQRDLAQACLLDLLRCRVQEVAILSYMLESSSFILLRHLEYFLLTCTKSRPPFSPHEKESIRRLQDYRSSPSEIQRELGKPKDTPMTKQELENFKSEVSSIISESFFEKLQSAQQHLSKGRSSVSFLEAITHRLKRLVKLQMR